MTDLYIGVDVGTTRVKAVAVDDHGVVRGESGGVMPWHRGHGRADIDPAALADLARDIAARAVVVDNPRVRAIGVTGMAETGVLVDGRDQPLCPAIAWYDPRGDADTIGRELDDFSVRTGLPLNTVPSLAKLLWLRRNRSDTASAVRFYSVAEWVVRRLGGEPVAELSLASRTGLLDLAGRRPWNAASDLLGLPPLLPEPVVAGTPAGQVTADDAPPVLRGAVLTVAGHDHQVAGYALGAATDGALLDSLGSAEGLVRTALPPIAPDRVAALTAQGISVGWGVLADHLCVLAGLPMGLTLNRLATMLGATTAADRLALGESARHDGGERTVGERPPPDDDGGGAPAPHPGGEPPRLVDVHADHFGIAGITDGVTPASLWRAAVDALVAESARVLDLIEASTGPHRDVVVAGGWVRDPAVLAAKRRQYPGMRTSDIAEPGAVGAALLAATAAGR